MVEDTNERSVEDECPVVGKREKAHERPIVAVFAFHSSDGDVGLITISHDSMKLWRVDESEESIVAFSERCTVAKWRCGVQSADASRDGKCILVLGVDSILHEILIGPDGPMESPHDFGYMEAWHIKMAKNGLNYMTTSYSGHLTEIDLHGNVSKREPYQNVKHISSIAYSNNSQLLAVANTEGLVHLLDTKTLKPINNGFEIHAMKIRAMCFTADDEYLLTGSDDKTLRLYQIAGERTGLVRQYCGNKSAILSAAFDESSAGSRFASCNISGEIMLWHINECVATHVLKSLHEGSVNDIVFSPSGRQLFAVGEDKQISCHKVPQLGGGTGDFEALEEHQEAMDYDDSGPVRHGPLAEDVDIDV